MQRMLSTLLATAAVTAAVVTPAQVSAADAPVTHLTNSVTRLNFLAGVPMKFQFVSPFACAGFTVAETSATVREGNVKFTLNNQARSGKAGAQLSLFAEGAGLYNASVTVDRDTPLVVTWYTKGKANVVSGSGRPGSPRTVKQVCTGVR